MARQASAEIDDEAAAWAARLDRAPLSAADEQALDAWLAADVRRVGAFAKARAVALHTERARALGPDFDPAAFVADPARPRGLAPHGFIARGLTDRRRLLWGAGAAVGAAAAAVVAATLGPGLVGERYSTRKGEVKVASLADGSVITLNTDSAVVVRYGRARRDIVLIRGEALFDVAKDHARPFVVTAGETRVRAVGTSFTVQRLESRPVQVIVREGVVEVARDAAGTKPVRMAANMRLAAPPSTDAPLVPAALPVGEVARQLSWREGRLAFEGETLAQAAADFGRYSDTRLVVDPDVSGEEITGLFQANDPVGFARAVAVSLDLKVEVGEGEVRLSRTAGA